MKIQYLVFMDKNNPANGLQAITKKEWKEILRDNRSLTGENRRFFIQDDITDGGTVDRIYMETTKECYRKWHAEYERAKYNREYASKFLILSGDAMAGTDTLFDVLPDSMDVEEMVLDNLQIQELKEALSEWKKWGPEMLLFYLNDDKRGMTRILSAKYHVSEQAVRKWKKCFEEFVLAFLYQKQ